MGQDIVHVRYKILAARQKLVADETETGIQLTATVKDIFFGYLCMRYRVSAGTDLCQRTLKNSF